jgi:hypothetical protein
MGALQSELLKLDQMAVTLLGDCRVTLQANFFTPRRTVGAPSAATGATWK